DQQPRQAGRPRGLRPRGRRAVATGDQPDSGEPHLPAHEERAHGPPARRSAGRGRAAPHQKGLSPVKFNLFLLPTIPASDETRRELRPIGRNTEHYQEMLTEVRDLTKLAEEVGFDSIGLTEHHLHSEGWEVSVAPLMLFADLAARTETIKFLTLGL